MLGSAQELVDYWYAGFSDRDGWHQNPDIRSAVHESVLSGFAHRGWHYRAWRLRFPCLKRIASREFGTLRGAGWP
jgi:hypothetical protein